MPRSLVLANGNFLIGLDHRAQVRDFYFPYVGMENHTGGKFLHRLGVWVENSFSWLDDPAWQISSVYRTDSLATDITAAHPGLQIKLNFTDVVYNEKDIFIRCISVSNTADRPRLVKLFFNQQFEIYESFRRDTALFEPQNHVILHYEGRRVFLVNTLLDDRSFDEYSTGLFNLENREGTFKDAEDGTLSQNPIEHGQVDSVIGVHLNLDAGKSRVMYYWITASKFMEEALTLNRYVLESTPQHLIDSTYNFWHAWTNRRETDFRDLPVPVVDLFKKSLLIIRAHADGRGGIIASSDSDLLQYGLDTYGYVWPRDGAISAMALDRAGDYEVAQRFFEFCHSVINPGGFFMHKYRVDQSLGSSWHPWVRNGQPQLPIQEDETALVVYALWQHYQSTRNLEFIEAHYNSLIKKASDFLVSYRYPATGLPKSSYDIWEEKYGTSTYTSATVYGALKAAGNLAEILGKKDQAARYLAAASEIKTGILTHLYDPKDGYFYKMINYSADPPVIDRTVDISGVYGIFKFGLLGPSDEKLTRALSFTLFRLGLTTLVGGVARYEGDAYYKKDPSLPGNPWFIATLWLAQYYLTQAEKPADLAAVRRLLSWTAKHATPAGLLSEQLDPHTGEQISASPLTWSHSEFVITVLDYLDKLKLLD